MTKYQLTSNYLINLRYKLKLSNSAGFIWNQAYPCDARGTKASVAHCSVVRFNSELFVQTTKLLSTWLYRLFPKYNTPVIRSSLKSRAISASPPLMWNWWKNLSVNLRPQLPFFVYVTELAPFPDRLSIIEQFPDRDRALERLGTPLEFNNWKNIDVYIHGDPDLAWKIYSKLDPESAEVYLSVLQFCDSLVIEVLINHR